MCINNSSALLSISILVNYLALITKVTNLTLGGGGGVSKDM